MLSVFLLERAGNLSFPPFSFVENRLSHFAIFCAHHILLFGGNAAIMRDASGVPLAGGLLGLARQFRAPAARCRKGRI